MAILVWAAKAGPSAGDCTEAKAVVIEVWRELGRGMLTGASASALRWLHCGRSTTPSSWNATTGRRWREAAWCQARAPSLAWSPRCQADGLW